MTAPAGSEDAGLVLSAEEVVGIPTHNEIPVTPDNLRWAATHEALCRSWIFDVLTGLADLLDQDAARIAQTPPPAGKATP